MSPNSKLQPHTRPDVSLDDLIELGAIARELTHGEPHMSTSSVLYLSLSACGCDAAAWVSAYPDPQEIKPGWIGRMEACVVEKGAPYPKVSNLDATFNWNELGLERIAEKLIRGENFRAFAHEMQPSEMEFPLSEKIAWFACAPYFTHEGWAGCLMAISRRPGFRPQSGGVEVMETLARLFGAATWRINLDIQLHQATTYLDSIMRYSVEYAIMLLDLNLRVLQINNEAELLFGPTITHRYGKRITEAALSRKLGLDSLEEPKQVVTRGEVWESEIQMPAHDDQPARTVNAVLSGIFSRGYSTGVPGHLSGYLLIGREVTEQKQRERRLLESQRMESVGMLAGGIAHDFNNILMGILGYASLAKDTVGAGNDTFRMLSIIEQSAERAAALTSQLLAYARGGKLQTTPVGIELMITDMLNIIGSTIPKTIHIEREEQVRLPNVMADPSQIQQVIMNLCLNASEAIVERLRKQPSSSERGTIRLKTGVARLDESPAGLVHAHDFHPHGEYVFLRVEDDGCGMTHETAARIFEPFFTTKFTGRGLGLAAVHGIIRNHGGAIAVESEPGVGTAFTVYLPSTEEQLEEHMPSAMVPLAGDETILIIDDEEVVRQLGVLTLANLGYKVLLATNGQEGLDVFHQHMDEISLVLLDLTMPGLDGAEVLAEISLLPRRVPVILTSGYDETSLSEISEGRYLSGFLQKPYTPEVLARAVREILNSSPLNKLP
jgi:signal transduction histidine kinase/ActR/RegA family two-component response regulator